MNREMLFKRINMYPADTYEVVRMEQTSGVYIFQIKDNRFGKDFAVASFYDLLRLEKEAFEILQSSLLEVLLSLGISYSSQEKNEITLTYKNGTSVNFQYAYSKEFTENVLVNAIEEMIIDAESILNYSDDLEGFAQWLDDLGFNRTDTYKFYEDQLENKKENKIYHEIIPPITQALETWKIEREQANRLFLFFGDNKDIIKEAIKRNH